MEMAMQAPRSKRETADRRTNSTKMKNRLSRFSKVKGKMEIATNQKVMGSKSFQKTIRTKEEPQKAKTKSKTIGLEEASRTWTE